MYYPSNYKIDFDNVTEQVYQCTKELAEKIGAISYTNQYKAYLHLSQGDKDAIRNTLINLERPFERHNQPQILDPSFWNLMPSYSAIEYTVGKQIPCPSSVQCTEEDCFFRDKTAPSHNPRPYTEHISSYLKSRGASDKNVNEYMDIIKLVYANLRNNIVHNSLMPISMPSEQEEDGTIIHDLEKIKAGFKTDSISMMSLSLALQSVARIMVLDKVFLTGTFTEVAWLKSFKFTGHTENKPS